MTVTTEIPTFTGPISGAKLGRTLIHEHVFVTSPELDRALPHPEWDEADAVEAAVALFQSLHDTHGVRTVVDLTVPGLGRNVALVSRVAARTPVRLIAATGWYTVTLPHAILSHGPGQMVDGPDPLVELFIGDIENGIEGSAVRAGMIKIASDANGITADVERVFTAAAIAHQQTGTPVTTHSHGTGGTAQQDLLEKRGVPLDRVVIGHVGDSTDLDYLREIARRGSYLGFDRFGMSHLADDEGRVHTLLTLLDEGYADQIVLSHDAAVFSRVTPPRWRARHTPQWRMDYLFTDILPRLRVAGVPEGILNTMLVTNPCRILGGASA